MPSTLNSRDLTRLTDELVSDLGTIWRLIGTTMGGVPSPAVIDAALTILDDAYAEEMRWQPSVGEVMFSLVGLMISIVALGAVFADPGRPVFQAVAAAAAIAGALWSLADIGRLALRDMAVSERLRAIDDAKDRLRSLLP